MAGDWHESIAKLISDNPDLAWELYEIGRDRALPVCTDAWHLADAGGRGRPVVSEVCPQVDTRAESLGAPIFKKREADRVVRLQFEDESELMVICEVQSEWKQDKYRRLPGYVARVFDDHADPVELVLVCKEEFRVVMEEAVREADPEWWVQASKRMAEKFSDEFIEEGREEGREEARSEELQRDRTTLYTLMNGLGVETGSQARARIEACSDPDELTTWITKVIRIRTADELFETPSE